MLDVNKRCLEVDYSAHPAFAPYAAECRVESNIIDDVLQDIDRNFRLVIRSEESLDRRFIHHFFRNQVNPIFTDLCKSVQSMIGSQAFYYPLLPQALTLTQNLLFQEAVYRNECKQMGAIPMNPQKAASYRTDLHASGCGLLKIAKDDVAKIWASLQDLVPVVHANREKAPWENAGAAIAPQTRSWELLWEVLRSYGAFEALSQFHQCRMEPMHATLIHSVPTETWYKDCYADVGLPNAQTSYMHFDGSFHVPKIIFYMTDVGPDNGPFSLIPSSHNLFKSYSGVLISKAMDLAAENRIAKEPKYKMQYRRVRYKVPELRKELMKLPNPLRGTSHFGEDVIDGTPLSNMLLSQEVVCTSDHANCILFDGAQNVHRGGLVKSGERWALQLSFNRPGFQLDWRRVPNT